MAHPQAWCCSTRSVARAPPNGSTKRCGWLQVHRQTCHINLQELAELQAPPPAVPDLDEWGFPIEPPSAAAAYADGVFEPADITDSAAAAANAVDAQASNGVTRYLLHLATDTARDVIIARAIANNRKVLGAHTSHYNTYTHTHTKFLGTTR